MMLPPHGAKRVGKAHNVFSGQTTPSEGYLDECDEYGVYNVISAHCPEMDNRCYHKWSIVIVDKPRRSRSALSSNAPVS